jgi:hypothetical protein
MKTHSRFKCGSEGFINIHREWAEPTRAELYREISRARSLALAGWVFAFGGLVVIGILVWMR